MEGLRLLVSVADGRISRLLSSAMRERGHIVREAGWDELSPVQRHELDAVVVDTDRVASTARALEASRYAEPPPVYAFVQEPTVAVLSELSNDGAAGFLLGGMSPEQLFAGMVAIESRSNERTRQRNRARKTAEALLVNRATSDALINALPDIMFRMSRTGEYLDFRAEDANKLAVPPDQIIGSSVHDVLPGEIAERALAAIDRALSSMDVELFEYSLETPAGERDFESRIVAANPDEVMVLVRDITDRKQLAVQLAMADRLSALGTLIAGIAHEINNPLTYVLIGIDAVSRELAKQDPGEPIGARMEIIRQRLRDALSGAQRVRRIVGELKAFARGDNEPEHAVDVRRVLDQVCAMVHDEVHTRGEMHREYGTTPLVSCNEDLLTQVFLHILLNATQALSSVDRATNVIRVTTSTVADRAIVEVMDTGHGIAPSDLDRIFDPFFTTKPLGVGTGLGLYMSRTIVARYGGSIRVDSTPGAGTRVTIELPASVAQVEEQPDAASPPGLGPGARVLVVDEDRGAADELSGFRVTHASTGSEAAAAMSSEQPFDVVLCDLLLPDQTGMELFAEVSSQHPDMADRFVFMTGDTFTPAIRAFLAGVSNVCVSKPIGSAMLEEVLRGRDND